ncbi:MAG: TIGR00341 family protein [Bacteroidales bacterium]|nr:TIGR00341 family protein [Bacteroidales bacterium]
MKNHSPRFSSLIKRLSLQGHIDVDAAARDIESNIYFTGPNTYILAFAIIVASIGLNVNSIPVIIGAMLISPLMGPIIGFGMSLGTNNFKMLRESLKNLAVMVAISIITSTLYFLLTPLQLDNPTELLARTNPTIYDVLIATVSGLAGILETSRKSKGTVIAGVAIATALMPPLCTIGFGIATLNLHYALGALYLFFINSVFIAFATFAGVKYLGFKTVQELDPIQQRRNRRRLALLVTVIIIPSIISAVNMVQRNNFERNADAFVKGCSSLERNYIYDHRIDHETSPSTVELMLLTDEIDSVAKEQIFALADMNNIARGQVRFKVNVSGLGVNNKLLEEVLQREANQMEYKDSIIARLQRENDLLREREQKYIENMSVIVEQWAQEGKTKKRK